MQFIRDTNVSGVYDTEQHTCLFDNCFIFCLGLCILTVFPVIAMKRFDLKIVSQILNYLVMILNLYLTSEWSQRNKRC